MNKAILFLSFFFLGGISFSQSSPGGNDWDTTKRVLHSNDKPSRKGKNNEKVLKDGYHKIYDSERRLVQDGDIKNGKFYNGKKYVYGENGNVVKVEIWKNGEYVEDGLLDNGQWK